jgi:hypothetical protein
MMSPTTSPRASSNRRPVVTNPQPTERPVGTVRGESDRVRLADVALTAALGVPGVLAGQADPLRRRVTETSTGERLEGVSCVAAPEGGYDVSLRLICGLVALQPLGERIRAAVRRAAVMAGITVQSVSVYFAELAVEGDR